MRAGSWLLISNGCLSRKASVACNSLALPTIFLFIWLLSTYHALVHGLGTKQQAFSLDKIDLLCCRSGNLNDIRQYYFCPNYVANPAHLSSTCCRAAWQNCCLSLRLWLPGRAWHALGIRELECWLSLLPHDSSWSTLAEPCLLHLQLHWTIS